MVLLSAFILAGLLPSTPAPNGGRMKWSCFLLSSFIPHPSSLLRQPTGLAYVETILRYVTRGTDKISLVELQQVVSEVFKEGAELMPTIAEQLIEQGRAEGLVKGREEGREAALRVLRRLLAQRFGIEPDRFDAELASLDLAALSRLTELAFEAKDLTEFAAELGLETGQANGGKGS
jgi:hypothetical protein